jgi:hypothetical protein
MVFMLHEQLARRGQVMCLVVPEDAPIHRMLAISEVSQLVEMYGTRDEAIEALAS